MSMSSKAADRERRFGFTLVEALVALVVAGFLLPALSRAMAGAWTATRTPMDVVSAMVLAREAASGASADTLASARSRGYAVERTTHDAKILVLPSRVAPAPRGADTQGSGDGTDPQPNATPAGIKLAIPASFGSPTTAAPQARRTLHRITVAVRTPRGRRLVLDTIGFDDAPP